jgi:hypothetical protein
VATSHSDRHFEDLADDDPALLAWLEESRQKAADSGELHSRCGLSATMLDEFSQFGGSFPTNGQRNRRYQGSE